MRQNCVQDVEAALGMSQGWPLCSLDFRAQNSTWSMATEVNAIFQNIDSHIENASPSALLGDEILGDKMLG